jgi:integrase
VFPKHRLALFGKNREPELREVDVSKPMGEWKKGWRRAREIAGVKYRWHDQRHTFVSRIAENPRISEGTIRSLAGHVSKKMLDRYSHVRADAKKAAIEALERDRLPRDPSPAVKIAEEGAQNRAQSSSKGNPLLN